MIPSTLLRRSTAALATSARHISRPSANTSFKLPFLHTFSTSTTNMGVHNIRTKTEFDEALKKPGLLVVDAFAEWCGPCKIIAPKLVEYSDKYPDVTFYKIDVDELSDVAQELGIRAMPTFTYFKDGNKIHEVVGANPSAIEAGITSNK